jgi:hypothetical protein
LFSARFCGLNLIFWLVRIASIQSPHRQNFAI